MITLVNIPCNMTAEELHALEWALTPPFDSKAAGYARILAKYIQRLVSEPFTVCLSCGEVLTEHTCPPRNPHD